MQIICPSCNKNARVRHGEANGKAVRVCAKCGANLDEKKADKSKKKAEKKVKKEPAAKSVKKSAKTEQTDNVPVDSASDGKTDKE